MSVIGPAPGLVPAASTGAAADTSRVSSDANLKKAGERFEAVFTGMMLGSMRKAKLADGLLDSKAADQFRDMWDQKLAENMAVTTPIGIGRAMTEFLSKAVKTPETPDSAQVPAAAAVDGGGTSVSGTG